MNEDNFEEFASFYCTRIPGQWMVRYDPDLNWIEKKKNSA